jgi:hypothetical protein
MRLDLAEPLPICAFALGMVATTPRLSRREDALAGIRPLLLGHMRPASHISVQAAAALSCGFLCALGVGQRPLRLFRWGGRG